MKSNIRYVLTEDGTIISGICVGIAFPNEGVCVLIQDIAGNHKRYSASCVFDTRLEALQALRDRVQYEVTLETRNAKSAQERAAAAISKLITLNLEVYNLKQAQ